MQIKALIKKIIPHFLLDFYHYLLAFIGAVAFWFPARKLIVIGVTGTSGKSTTVDFTTRILEESGNNVVSNSSIRFKVGNRELPNNLKMGMPGRFFMQKLLRQGVKKKCNYAVLEVTSEGIRQYRHKFINFNTVVFTNLTPEHIESHGGFENYRNEKLKLFKSNPSAHVINIDDENSKYFLNVVSKEKWKYSTAKSKIQNSKSKIQNIIGDDIQVSVNGTSFVVDNVRFNLNLLGRFNVYNALAAISVGLSQGISLEICKKALEKVSGIPGRMEIVAKKPFWVIVDYAHTPEQIEGVYRTLSENSKLICVLGSCGGGRDKWKRPILGRIAKKYCNQIIITNEDPYDENPIDIMKQVYSGIKNPTSNTQYLILDRRQAIKKALELANPNDVVIITGKGSESLMCIENGKKIPWSDRQIVKEEFEKSKVNNAHK